MYTHTLTQTSLIIHDLLLLRRPRKPRVVFAHTTTASVGNDWARVYTHSTTWVSTTDNWQPNVYLAVFPS